MKTKFSINLILAPTPGSVFETRFLPTRNAKPKQLLGCADIRVGILLDIKCQLSKDWIERNVNGHQHYLHLHKSCLFDTEKENSEKQTRKEEISTALNASRNKTNM